MMNNGEFFFEGAMKFFLFKKSYFSSKNITVKTHQPISAFCFAIFLFEFVFF